MTQYKMPGDHVISVNHNFGAITDYYPVCDNPNGISAWGYRYDPHKPQIRYTWYDRYLQRRYEEMRRLANEESKTIPSEARGVGIPHPIKEDIHLINRYAMDFYDRYLRNRRYYYGSGTQRE